MFLQAYEHSSGVSKLSFVCVEVVLLGGEGRQPLERWHLGWTLTRGEGSSGEKLMVAKVWRHISL